MTKGLPRRLLEAIASLRLTVALMALSMVLIFMGTLAQVELGVWQAVDLYFRSLVAWIDLQLLVPRGVAEVPVKVPFPGGFLLGILFIANLVAAHALRFRLEARRIGILVLHAGLVVLLLGEFATGAFSREGLMSIDVGGSSNFVEDIREVELVVVDPSDPEVDRVVAIPQGMVEEAARTGRPIRHESLPFDIVVDQWMPNSRLLVARGPTPADRGVGTEAEADPIPRVRGVDGAAADSPSAYVSLVRDGRALGTWMLSAHLVDSQPVRADGVDHGIALRYRREYKPFTLHLDEFRHDVFTGTNIARNFSSHIRLVDPGRGIDRQTVIWMNNPLRHGGATFYQASYKPDGSGTVLQVVRNPGSALPYIACVLVGGGMLLHFWMGLAAFLRRRSPAAQAPASAGAAPLLPAGWRTGLALAGGAAALLVVASPWFQRGTETEFDFEAFASLPVSAGGRIKPVDSQARHVLAVAGGRQSVRTDNGRVPATRFLADLMAQPEAIAGLPVVRVDHPGVLALMGLAPEDGGRISLATIERHWDAISEQAMQAFEVDSRRRDPFQRAVTGLYGRVGEVLAHSSMSSPHAIPPLGPDEDWRPFAEAFLESGLARPPGHPAGPPSGAMHPAVAYWIAMMTAYNEGDAAAFNQAVRGYDALLRRDMPGVMRKADFEVAFNRLAPFLGASAAYVLAFMMLCAMLMLRARAGSRWDGAAEGLRVSATAMMWVALAVHTLAIVARVWIQERPPVTNLYSSAVFVGWAAVLLGLVLERLWPIGLAAMGAAAVGFATLVVAHGLGSGGDTLEMMQAVLDSNFWLATHVVTITLGYSAVFLAAALGIAYIGLGVFTPHLTKDRARALSRMAYGVVCFALLLSFVGTVLGGIWADQSWGRFWGWDPKENGAALIVLLAAIILHARWGGMIRDRGIMVLAVGGGIVTAWSWFGTNMLGVGLHSYGFMDSAAFWLVAFVASQLAVMATGLLPMAAWRSTGGAPRGGGG